MASNKELIEEATTLGAKLRVEVVTDGLKNDALAALVAELRGKLDAEHGALQSTVAAERQAKAEAEAEVIKAPTHAVAPGKSVTSRRGIIGPGQSVTARDFAGGDESIRSLVSIGALVVA